jgi:hypothetical protein
MIDDERRFNALNIDKLRVTVFFFLIFAVGILSFVDRLRRKAFRRKLKLERETVFVSQFEDVVAFAQRRFAFADVA